jgi:hypothetical protein
MGLEDIEVIARRLRRDVGVDDRFCPDMIFTLKQLVSLGMLSDIVTDADIPDEARYESDANKILLNRSIFSILDHPFRAEKISRRRARFTVAHELGHLAGRHQGSLARGTTSATARRIVSRARTFEIEADSFAAAFLIPHHLVKANIAVLGERPSKLNMLSNYLM